MQSAYALNWTNLQMERKKTKNLWTVTVGYKRDTTDVSHVRLKED